MRKYTQIVACKRDRYLVNGLYMYSLLNVVTEKLLLITI